MEIIQSIFSNILSFSSDAVLVAVLIALGGAYSFFKGKDGMVALILAFYPAILLFQNLPFLNQYTANNLANSTDVFVALLIFAGLLFGSHLVLNKFISSRESFSKLRHGIESIVLGAIFAALVLWVTYNLISIDLIYNFSPAIDALFAGSFVFWWLLAPMVAFFVLK